MTVDQLIIIAVLVATMAMLLWGKWRHDLVALAALLVCVLTGLVPADEAFSGFGHPAVVTVACVLVLGHGLQKSGAVNVLAQRCLPADKGPTISILALVGLAALLSGFMNNVGALALLMPVAMQLAASQQLPPGRVLMPLAFGSILGGMTTLIGTPPNLIVSGFRAEAGMGSFAMFDFTPVGLAVAAAGVAFVGLAGWRLVPVRRQADAGSFDSAAYLSEVRIVEDSKAVGMSLREAERLLDEADAQIVGLVRGEVRIPAPNSRRLLQADDILVIEVEPESLALALSSLGLKLEGGEPLEDDEEYTDNSSRERDGARGQREGGDDASAAEEGSKGKSGSDEIVIQELVVTPAGRLVGRSATEIELRSRYGINLLAISREGRHSIKRLQAAPVQGGDVLLVQGIPESLSGFAAEFGCLPLAARDIRVPREGQALTAGLIMAVVVGTAALGVLPAAIAFATGVLLYVGFKLVPLRSVYSAIDWPVIMLLGAMLPVADALASTGTADMLAQLLLDKVAQGQAVIGLVLLLVVTMFLSDLMNNAATAAVMCPIAISTAAQLGVSADAFLMAIAVGASCAFLTPIGHQNNTLILGPGGFRFGDYWRLGLMVELIVIVVAVPMLLWVWPL